MKKLLKIITGVTLSLAMAIGASVGVANNKNTKAVYATSSEWELVTSAPADWSGEYILCNGTTGTVKMMDGSSFESSSCAGIDVVVADSKITADDSDAITIAKSSTNGKYTVVVNGKYVGRNANSNGMDAADSWSANYDNAISYSSGKVIIAGNGGRTLTWYASNSNFRYYASSNNCTQLFKKVESSGGDPNPTISFSKESINGEVNDEFSFTWTEQDLENPITWSPASASTDIIDYEVNTGTKTVTGTLKKAGEVTLTATSGDASDSIDFTVAEHETHRKYTVTSKTAVSQSGDTMTGATPTYSQTYGTAKQATKGNSMTLSITGLTKKVSISKLILSMHSNQSEGAGSISISIDGKPASFIAGTSSSVGAGFNTFGDNSEYSNSYKNVTWAGLNYTAKSSIIINIYCIGTNSLHLQ